MNRLFRAIAHALQRLASLLLGVAGNEDAGSPQRPVRADGSPPPDWLRRMRRDPPRDWLERVRRGRPRWIGGTTPVPPASLISPPPPGEGRVGVDSAADPPPQGKTEVSEILSTPTNPTLPREEGGRYPSTPHRDPLRQSGRASSGSVGGRIVEAPTPHRSPPPQGGRARSGRVGGEIAEADTPHPEPPRQGGRLRLFRPNAPPQWERQDTPHPDPPPQGGTEINPQEGRERFAWWGVEESPHPGPPPQGGRERDRHWGREDTTVYGIEELDAPTPTLPERLKRSPGTDVSIARMALKRHSRGATPRAPLAWGDGPGEQGRETLPWPDLPDDPPADSIDPVTLWRDWDRRERLAREQRGD